MNTEKRYFSAYASSANLIRLCIRSQCILPKQHPTTAPHWCSQAHPVNSIFLTVWRFRSGIRWLLHLAQRISRAQASRRASLRAYMAQIDPKVILEFSLCETVTKDTVPYEHDGGFP